jgi:trehalose 6-phosphate phosphatase
LRDLAAFRLERLRFIECGSANAAADFPRASTHMERKFPMTLTTSNSTLAHQATVPAPSLNWALFLDLDGTLLDIARTPRDVAVPPDLLHDLAAAYVNLGGALAIVSGRILSEVDALLSPLVLPGAGEHGAVVRLPNGQRDEVDAKVPLSWVERLDEVASTKPGTFVERKSHNVAVHYRSAPEHKTFYFHLCKELIGRYDSDFELLPGRATLEIRPRTVSKARAVKLLMGKEPFRGRKPMFVGDDVTDDDGFKAAEQMGGEGHHVAHRFGGRPDLVRKWLKSIAAV